MLRSREFSRTLPACLVRLVAEEAEDGLMRSSLKLSNERSEHSGNTEFELHAGFERWPAEEEEEGLSLVNGLHVSMARNLSASK